MSRFVSAGANEEQVERDDEWIKAREEVEANQRKDLEPGRQEGGKTLYEVLQANKGMECYPYCTPRYRPCSG